LLPAEDPRYRFFLFPLHYGLPESQALPYHPALAERCKEISPRQVNFLRTRAPLLKVEAPAIDFDEIWYAHTYLLAAVEISEGWFAGPLEHYVDIGARRGYKPLPDGFSHLESGIDASLVDLSLEKRATQSSISKYSCGSTVETDASRALASYPQTPYAFHTSLEANPWWSVDLGDVCRLQQVVILNRCEQPWVTARAAPLIASASLDSREWSLVFKTPDSLIPGANGKPLIWTARDSVPVRYFRLAVSRESCLHLRQVRLLGYGGNLGVR
jgi:hypothetical protein